MGVIPKARSRTGNAGVPEKPYVMFDTNVVEGRCLRALISGDRCREFDRVREHGYEPAVAMHTVLEIANHAKLGDKRFPWMCSECGYPGGKAVGEQIVRRILGARAGMPVGSNGSENDAVEANFYWYFSICEEWRGLDAMEIYPALDRLVDDDGRERMIREAEHMVEFARWKCELSAFCRRIFDVIEEQAVVLTAHSMASENAKPDGVVRLERELMANAILPNEDIALVQFACAVGAAALVTEDARLVKLGGLSLNMNYKLAFVRPDHLGDALENGFWWRWRAP